MSKSTLERIREIQAARKSGGKKSDDRFWSPTDYGTTVVRFLPAKREGEIFFKEFGEHWIEGDDGKKHKYICPRITNQKKCPICETGYELFNTGDPQDERYAKSLMPRKLAYANVLVRGAGEDGEDLGPKVYKFGKQVSEAILDACSEDECDVDISDAEEGYDFKIVKKKKRDGNKDWPSYTSSKAVTKAPTPIEEDELETLLEEAVDIHDLIDSEVKTYKEIKAEFQAQLSGEGDDDEDFDDDTETTAKTSTAKIDVADTDDDDDDATEEFNEEDFLQRVKKAVND